jgi:DNA repair exonuclease SbcCD ATPase subunit
MPDTIHNSNFHDEDEIDLYPYFLAIRKRWKMIFILVLIAVLGAYIATGYLPKVYRVNALISLGRVELGDRIQPVATIDDINQFISSGNLLKKIAAACKLDADRVGSTLEKGLSAEAKANSEYVFLKYDTAQPEQGLTILNALITEIQKKYNPRTENYRLAKDSEIDRLQEEIVNIQSQQNIIELTNKQITKKIEQKNKIAEINKQTLETQKAAILTQIRNCEDKIQILEETQSELAQVTTAPSSYKPAAMEGETNNAKADKIDNLITALLVANNIQQNIAAMNQSRQKRLEYDLAIRDARKEIEQLKSELAKIDGQIIASAMQTATEIDELETMIEKNELEMKKNIPAKIATVKHNMQRLKIQKSMIEGIEVIAEPDYLNDPIQSKRKMIMVISAFMAIFVGICMAIVMNQNVPTQK